MRGGGKLELLENQPNRTLEFGSGSIPGKSIPVCEDGMMARGLGKGRSYPDILFSLRKPCRAYDVGLWTSNSKIYTKKNPSI